MLKQIKNQNTVDVKWQGEVVATARGLSPADFAVLIAAVGEDVAKIFDVQEKIDELNLDTKNPARLADQLLAFWPQVIQAFAEHMPNLLARIIATACNEPDQWQMVRDNYNMTLQFDILIEVARLTFNDPEGFKRFVGNVLSLVDLAGTLTSVSTKRPSTRGGRRSLAAG